MRTLRLAGDSAISSPPSAATISGKPKSATSDHLAG
jgi:hypothetical protein